MRFLFFVSFLCFASSFILPSESLPLPNASRTTLFLTLPMSFSSLSPLFDLDLLPDLERDREWDAREALDL